MLQVVSVLALTLLQTALLLAAAPVLAWAVDAVARRAVGRHPVPFRQPWRDLARMLRKQSVMADTASPMHRLRPWIECATALCLVVMVPAATVQTLFVPAGDLLLLASLWMFGQGLALLSLFETGRWSRKGRGGEGGVGDRLLWMALTWGAVVAAILAVAATYRTTALAVLVDRAVGPWPLEVLGAGLAAPDGATVLSGLIVLAVLVLALTVSEGRRDGGLGESWQVDDYSGRHAALVTAAAMLRRVAGVMVIWALLAPGSVHGAGDGPVGFLIALVLLVPKFAVAALVLGLLRCLRLRPRRRRLMAGASIGFSLVAALVAAAIGAAAVGAAT